MLAKKKAPKKVAAPKLNVPFLKELKTVIKDHPNYNQEEYCESGACVAGFAYLLTEQRKTGKVPIFPDNDETGTLTNIVLFNPAKGTLEDANIDNHKIHKIGQKALGLTEEQANWLFRGHHCTGNEKGKEIQKLIDGKADEDVESHAIYGY
jgi:hypothetical protein